MYAEREQHSKLEKGNINNFNPRQRAIKRNVKRTTAAAANNQEQTNCRKNSLAKFIRFIKLLLDLQCNEWR